MRYLVLSVISLCLLSACGSEEKEPVVSAPPKVNKSMVFSGPLMQPGAIDFSRYVKNGIYASTVSTGTTAIPDGAVPSPPPTSDAGFSTTNTQEAGVDEADRIEYDGSYLYVSAYPDWQDTELNKAYVRILQRQQDFSMNEVARIPLEQEYFSDVNSLYLWQQRLAVINSTSPIMPLNELFISPTSPFHDKVSVSLLNVADATEPQVLETLEIDGQLLGSRRIDNQLYLVTSYTATMPELQWAGNDKAKAWANYHQIQAVNVGELMPKLHRHGVATPLNQPDECYIPSAASNDDGHAQLLTLVRINLQQPDDISALCLGASADLLYMSSDTLYLSGTLDHQTVLHKISLHTELDYRASGLVDGVIGWRGPGQLRFSEADNYLRVLTSNYLGSSPEHRLFVLTEQGQELVTVGELPNAQQPEPIGKPGEDVYAVRYIDDKAYVVTFEFIDPLYVIDVSNPQQPMIAGSLEIPGFSSYLQPLANGFLLGVGQQVSPQEIPANGSTEFQAPVIPEGLKISLFDVRDPANPLEIDSIHIAQAYTPVEWDYRALSWLEDQGRYQLALPYERWEASEETASVGWWRSTNGLLMLEVDSLSGNMLERNRQEVSNEHDRYIYGGNDRSVIHGNHLYYVHGNQVWHILWQDGAELDGPF